MAVLWIAALGSAAPAAAQVPAEAPPYAELPPPSKPKVAHSKRAKAKAKRGKRGLLLVVRNGGKAGLMDGEGRLVLGFEYEEIGSPDGDVINVRRGSRWGLVDRAGREVVAPQFEWLGDVVDGRAAVRIGDRFGYVDESGELVIPAEYAAAYRFRGGYGEVQLADRTWRYVDRAGVLQPEGFRPPPPKAPKPKKGKTKKRYRALVRFEDGGRVGFRDDQGKTIVPARYTRADDFDVTRGVVHARVWDDAGKCGYLDATGAEVVAPAYDDCRAPYADRAAVARGGQWGFVDVLSGKQVVPLRYDEVRDSWRDHVIVRQGGKWGIVDARGRVVITPRFAAEPLLFGQLGVVYERRGGATQRVHFTRDDRVLWTDLDPSPAMVFDRVRAVSAAWARHDRDAAARARAVPHVQDAVAHFFASRLDGALRALVEAELALGSDQPPAAGRVAAEMVAAHVPAVLDPQGVAAFYLHPLLRDPAGAGLTVAWELRDAGGASTWRAGSVPLGDAPTAVAVDLSGVPDGDHVIVLRVLDGEEVVRAWEVPTSVITGLGPRLDAARAALEQATAPDLELATVTHRSELLTAPGRGRPFPHDVSAHRLLVEVEDALARWAAGDTWWRETPGSHEVAAWYREVRVPMRLHVPAKRAPRAPLVIALHGDGVDRSWWSSEYADGLLIEEAERRGWYVLAVHTHADHAVPAALWAAQRLVRYDPDRVYLVGHSRGGLVALEAFAAAPALYAGVVALAPGPKPAAAVATDAPIFVARGDLEVPWIVTSTDATRDALAAAGATRAEYRVYPGVEHLLIVAEALRDGLDHVTQR